MKNWVSSFVGSVAEAWDEIRIHRLRVILSLLAVGIAIAVMTGVLALGQQMAQAQKEILEKVTGRSVTLSVNAFPENFNKSGELREAVATFLKRYDIEYASRMLYNFGNFKTKAGNIDLELQIVDPAYATIHRLEVSNGSWFGEGDVQRLAPAAVVNQAFIDQVGIPANLSVQPDLTMLNPAQQAFVVIGVVPNSGEWEGPKAYVLFDSYMNALSEEEQQSLMPSWEIWLPEEHVGTAKNLLESELRPIVGQGGYVEVYPTNQFAGEDVTQGTRMLIFGISLAVLFLGALSLVNIAMVTVKQRVREIGIRRSFGASSSRVFFAIMMESLVGTLLAGIAGVAIAIVTLRWVPFLQMLNMPVQDTLPFPMGTAVIGILAATAIGALAGLLPGLFATRVRPVDAIRT